MAAALRGTARSPSRSVLSSQCEDAGVVAVTPLTGLGCTCGAGLQLENERVRLVSNSRCLSDRSESLALRDAELEERVRGLDGALQRLAQSERELQERHADVEARLAQSPTLLDQVAEREEKAGRAEEELEQQASRLAELESEATSREGAVAQEELLLMQERNSVEAELERVRQGQAELDAKAEALSQEREDCLRQLDEAERERQMLRGDEALLTEIEQQVGLVRGRLSERERALAADETDFRAREADCEEREARLLPECRLGAEALARAEERLRELCAREEESKQQQCRLLRRQRDLGGEEIRLSGLEGALLRRQGGLAGPAAGPGGGEAGDVEEMQRRLHRLKHADADWVERVRLQQLEVDRLEAKVLRLEASSDAQVLKARSSEKRAAKIG
mmetsp:Transcript_109309/g.352876  ORF Transcript_109309/g.352876 Transcript_109309/m.352876 type:complete len:394 (+) Transcript_109309:70-1251(+)